MAKQLNELPSRIMSWTVWRVATPFAMTFLVLSVVKMAGYSWMAGWATSAVDHLRTAVIVTAVVSSGYELYFHARAVADAAKKLTRIVDQHSVKPTEAAAPKTRPRTLVGIMANEFEASLYRISFVLFAGLAMLAVTGLMTSDRRVMSGACVVAVLVLTAHARQGVLRWRVERGYFGTSEHEVRELLRFAMRHPTPKDFLDGGSMMPAFAIGERPEMGTAWSGDPSGAGATS
jgi:hypothetical protein